MSELPFYCVGRKFGLVKAFGTTLIHFEAAIGACGIFSLFWLSF